MKQDESLINYLTDIILRPHREIYGIQKLGPNKIVVKSHEKGIFLLQSMSRSEKIMGKEWNGGYCQLIEVNRHEVTIKCEGKAIQASVYEPQLTSRQKKSTEVQANMDKNAHKNPKSYFSHQNKQKPSASYQNCVIFLHANSGSRIQGTEYAKHVLQYRTLCVSFDYTGSGISQGNYTTMGINESKDLSAVIQYVAEKYNVKNFSLWGRSMGAVTGIYYLITKYKEDVKKIRVTSCIIDSPFSDLQKLILEIASKRSNLPQFVFQPFMYRIQKEIISKIGINIFAQLNLVEKIKKLSGEDLKLLNSVSFLGLASKDDKMISHQHCEQLCQLLIPRDVRNLQLIDDKNLFGSNMNDKHLMMLIDFKKEINTKGDFMHIEGDHNKPRTKKVKEKISFFIEENFISYKDPFANVTASQTLIKQQQQKPLHFGKTGLSIKGKLASTKNGIKPKKDSQTLKDPLQFQSKIKATFSQIFSKPNHPQPKAQQPTIQGLNYNLINLKEIKAKKQAKQSLSREKQSISNSLSKNFLFKERRNPNASLQTGNKGLNIVSKEFNKDRVKLNEQTKNQVKASFNTMQSSSDYDSGRESTTKPHVPSSFSSFMSKFKAVDSKPKHKDQNTSIEYMSIENNRTSENNDSVNNSLKKQDSNISGDHNNGQILVGSLNFLQNNPTTHPPPNLTHRLPRPEKYFQSLPSQRQNRNIQSQTYVYHSKLQQSPGVSTTPFNLSIDNSSNMSFEMHNSFQDESFRKKESSQILDATDLPLKKEVPKTPQVKISISEFRNRHEDESNNKSAHKKHHVIVTKKENTFGDANLQTNRSFKMNQPKGPQSAISQDKLSSKHSLQFKKRQPAETNSIQNSDMSHQQIVDHNRSKNYQQYNNNTRRQPYINHAQVHMPHSHKHPNVSSSFTQNVLIKNMMMNNGHKGLTQSSTFGTYVPYPQYVYPQVQGNGQHQNYMKQGQQKQSGFNGYYSVNGQMGAPIQSMWTSQDQYSHVHQQSRQYHNGNSHMQHPQPNIFLQNKPTSQSATYGTNTSVNSNINISAFYNPNQSPKQPIEYKKKITRLLD